MYEVYSTFNGGAGPGEYNLNGIAAKDMVSSPRFPDRGYPGRNPWAEPGSSIECYGENRQNCGGNSVAYNTYPINTELGVCGTSIDNDRINYNTPSPSGVFGQAPTDDQTDRIYAPGEVIDVAWCVSADHGGIPMFRLCPDQSLVEAVTRPNYEPSLLELEDLETCFQDNLLRCDDVPENAASCELVSACDGNPQWAACEPGKYIHCNNELNSDKYYSCINTYESSVCGDYGTLARYKLKIPEDFPASAHTIMSFRWDTLENNEVFVGCADIKITGDNVAPPPDDADDAGSAVDDAAAAPCGVSSCTPEVLDTIATAPTESASCGDRIDWVIENRGKSELDACRQIAVDEFPVECGGCDPDAPADDSTDDSTDDPVEDPADDSTNDPAPPSSTDGVCCSWTDTNDPCDCVSPYPVDNYCAQSKAQCNSCVTDVPLMNIPGKDWWCPGAATEPAEAPTDAPVDVSTPSPVDQPTPSPPTEPPTEPSLADLKRQIADLQAIVAELTASCN